MIGQLGIARFGNVDGSHELQGQSGVPDEVLRAIQWYTDLPSGPLEDWRPFNAGFPVADHYVVRYTRPDLAAERAGMVSTTVLVADTDIYRHSLRPLLEHSAHEPAIEPVLVSLLPSALPEVPPVGLAGVIDALARRGRVIWLNQAGFSEMVAALWDALAPEDRRQLVFGLVWHPDAIPYPIGDASRQLMVLTAPAELRQRFDEWPIVNPSEPPPAGRIATSALQRESDRVTSLATRLAIDQPTLLQWTQLVEAADLCAELDDLAGERLRGIAHLVAVLAPDHESGADLKAAIVRRISETTATADFAHIRGLRTFPVQAYPIAPDLAELLSRWAERVIADSRGTKDLATAVETTRAVPVDEWSRELASALIDAARRDLPSTRARLTDLVDRDQQRTFDWLADACPDDDGLDLYLSTWATSRPTPAWLSGTALQREWAMTHAVSCSTDDSIGAWRRHTQIAQRSALSDNTLASRAGSSGTVRAALALSDSALVQIAGRLVARAPALLAPARVTDHTWRAVWLSAIDAGADPWAAVPAAEAVSQLLDVLIGGESVSESLLDAAAESESADLSDYPRRASVWECLPSGIRDRFLKRTARALALSTADDLASLEPYLIAAILRPDNLEAAALLDVDRAVDILDQLANHVTPEAVLTVTSGPNLSADCSARLGHLVVSRKLKAVAKDLAKRARKRPDLRPAATTALTLLSLSDRITFRLRVGGVAPTADEVQHLTRELMVKLYSKGPMDRSLWARSGGDPADLPEAPTPREQWRLASDAIAAGARGAPELSALLDVTLKDYNRKDLKQLRKLL